MRWKQTVGSDQRHHEWVCWALLLHAAAIGGHRGWMIVVITVEPSNGVMVSASGGDDDDDGAYLAVMNAPSMAATSKKW